MVLYLLIIFSIFPYCLGCVGDDATGLSTNIGANVERIREGKTIDITCNCSSGPSNDVEWLKNGHPMASDDDRITVYSNGRLLIKRATEADVGEYTCKIYGQSDHCQKLSFLMIDLETLAPTTPVTEGGNLTIKCIGSGLPKPTLKWSKDNVTAINLLPMTDEEPNVLTLHETNITEHDLGSYTCTASNHDGVLLSTTTCVAFVSSDAEESSSSTGIIVGVVLGLLALLALVAVDVNCYLKKDKGVTAMVARTITGKKNYDINNKTSPDSAAVALPADRDERATGEAKRLQQ